jgi:hypothetical protein
MAPKSKQAEGEDNSFLPPPVDLDRIPLADKDRLIADTKCDFNFLDLQSWFKEVFLDQSDEIGLWESNLPLYLFPQIHPFPEFTLKCQAHYIPKQRTIVSSSGEANKGERKAEANGSHSIEFNPTFKSEHNISNISPINESTDISRKDNKIG